MKSPGTAAALGILIPNRNRRVFTDMLIAGETIVPGTKQELLIDEPFFYSHEWDVEKALRERFTIEWRKREYAVAIRDEERWQKYVQEGENPDGLDAVTFFKYRVKRELRWVRRSANDEIARFWVRLLKHRPEYVDRCPWRFFQGDLIWWTLRDEEFLRTIKHTPLQLAEKMDLKAMSLPDWDEVLKIVPELAVRCPKFEYVF